MTVLGHVQLAVFVKIIILDHLRVKQCKVSELAKYMLREGIQKMPRKLKTTGVGGWFGVVIFQTLRLSKEIFWTCFLDLPLETN